MPVSMSENLGRRVLSTIGALLPPVLLAAFPLLSLFAQNQTDLELRALWWPLVWCLAGASVIYGLFLLATRRATRASVMASFSVLAFSYYGLVTQRGAGWFLAGWLLVLVVVLVLTLRIRRGLVELAVILGLAGAAMSLPQVVRITAYYARHSAPSASDPRLWPTTLDRPPAANAARLPDIYVIIPDDYARADVLRKYFHYDNSGFVRQLEQRGFTVSDQSVSPYSDSESNIAALVNMDYLTNFGGVMGKRSEDVRPVQRVIQDNRSSRILRSQGYDYVHIDTDEVTFSGGNPHISPLAPPDSLTNLWLEQTLLRTFGGALGFDQAARNERYRSSITTGFRRLSSIPQGGRPKFVVFHTLLPHDPYVYDERGHPVTYQLRTEEDLASADGRLHYRHQLQHLSTMLLGTIDTIMRRSTTPPVVLIQSDEGFQANPQPFGEAAMEHLRVKGLSAFYLPGERGTALPAPLNSVNDLRLVFNRYLGTRYDLLPSATYPEADYPYVFKPMNAQPAVP